MVFHWKPSEEVSTEYEKESLLPRTTSIFPTAARAANLTVRLACGSAATHDVDGLPSTAATGGDPGSEEVAVIGRHRARSSVGSRSGRRVGRISAVPRCTVFRPPGVMTGSVAPALRVTVVSRGPIC